MKVAIIGLGAISPLHIEAVKSLGGKIVAICDVDKTKVARANEEYSLGANEYTNYVEMLDNESIDVVHICTPHYLHAPMAEEALARDINVLTEKPLAINERQLEELDTAVGKSKARLGVCFQTRYDDSKRKLKEIIRAEDVKAAYVNLVWVRDKAYYESAGWRGTKTEEGGGVLINQAIHSLDLMQWVCGMPESVTARCFNDSLKGVIEVEDTVHAVYDLGKNRNVIFNATNASKTCFPNVLTFVTKEKTAMLIGDELFVNGERIAAGEDKPTRGKKEWGSSHERLISDFYDCIESGRKFGIDFYEGSKTMKILLATYSSDGKEIKI